MNPLDHPQELSEDLAEFTGLGRESCIRDVSTWMNNYVTENELYEGDVPGTVYPGPTIFLDECLNYLFKPYFEELGIRDGDSIKYSHFKSLCLKHMTMMY